MRILKGTCFGERLDKCGITISGWSEGNYTDYDADRKKRLGALAERPHRLRYKRLHRG